MLRRFSVNFAVFSLFLDIALVIIALAVATLLRPSLSKLPFVEAVDIGYKIPLTLYFIFPILWVLVLQLLAVYDGRRNLRFFNEISSLTFGALLAIVVLAGTLYLSFRDVSRFLFLSFALLAFLFQLLWRILHYSSFVL